MSAWFFGSRVRGCLFVLFLVVLLRGCAGVRGAGCGWFRVWGSMWCARFPSIIECWWGLGVLGPVVVKWFRGGRVAPGSSSPCWVVGGWACFFPLGVLCSSGSGVGLRGLVGVGGLGGVGLGWGFFSGFCCSARAGAGSCLVAGVGVGCGLFWFCLESLILAQDERWRRA